MNCVLKWNWVTLIIIQSTFLYLFIREMNDILGIIVKLPSYVKNEAMQLILRRHGTQLPQQASFIVRIHNGYT